MKGSWKNKSVFEQQLELNLREINEHYPGHWFHLITILQNFPTSSMLDIGCGAGIYSALLKKHFPSIKYSGCDYSQEAITLASKTWPSDEFFVQDFWGLTHESLSQYDMVVLNAVLDVFPDGDDALEFILGLQPKSICLQRADLTQEKSYVSEYEAYGIQVYKFHHNENNFFELIEDNGYKCYEITLPHQKRLSPNTEGNPHLFPPTYYLC